MVAVADLFDTSRIRDEAVHWDAMAERVVAEAVRRSSRAGGGGRGFAWLGDSRASWVAASLLLAAALAFMAATPDDASTRSAGTSWAQTLAPADDVGKALISREGPPPIGALLLVDQGRTR